MSSHRTMRRLAAGLTVAATSTAVVLAGTSAAQAAPAPRPTFGGLAFGSTVRLGSTIDSDRTAMTPMCTQSLKTNGDTTAGISIDGVGTLGAVKTFIKSHKVKGGYQSRSVSRTAATNLLAAIHLDAVSSVSTATQRNGKVTLAGSATFANLTIAGQKVPTQVDPNTSFSLPLGLAKITVNWQRTTHRHGIAKISTEALRIEVLKNNLLGLPGGVIIVGASSASIHQPMQRLVKGSAYGTLVDVGDGVIKSGRTAPAYMPCGGTSGTWVQRNATAKVTLPGVLDLGAISSKTRSVEHKNSTSATAINSIGGVSLLGGVVKAQAIVTKSTVTRSGGKLVRSSDGTKLASLTIAGQTTPVTTDPNQSFSIPGIGTLYFNRVIPTKAGLQVYAIQIVLGSDTAGLPAGATINVGSANAVVYMR